MIPLALTVFVIQEQVVGCRVSLSTNLLDIIPGKVLQLGGLVCQYGSRQSIAENPTQPNGARRWK